MQLNRKLIHGLTLGCSWLCFGFAQKASAQEKDPELAMVERVGPEKRGVSAAQVALAHRRSPPSRELAPVVGAVKTTPRFRAAGNIGPGNIEPGHLEPRGETPSKKTPSKSRQLPWVGVHKIEAPYPQQEDTPAVGEINLPPWSLFQVSDRYALPEEDDTASSLPLFYVPPPRRSDFSRALERVAQRKIGSEVRRRLKRTLRREFESTPTMSYASYLGRISEINRLGRQPQDYDDLSGDHFKNELKEDIFRDTRREGERDFEVFALGPLLVMDSGSVRFDVGRAVQWVTDRPGTEKSEAHGPELRSVLATKSYRVNTSLKLGFDPLDAMKREDPTWAVDRYGVTVEVSWLSDVLGREMLTTECEFQVERNGDFAAIVSVVLNSRH